MAPGARSKFGAPMFEPELIRKQMYCIKESTCVIVGTFRRPPWRFGARGIVPPCPPLFTTLRTNSTPKQIQTISKYDFHTDPCTVYVRIYIIITVV